MRMDCIAIDIVLQEGCVVGKLYCNTVYWVCNTPKYTLAVLDMFRVFCQRNLNVS